MKNAKEMRETAEKVRAEKRKMVDYFTYKYLESDIAPLIEEAANAGKMYIKTPINIFVNQELLKEKLRFLGYIVLFKNADGIIEILW